MILPGAPQRWFDAHLDLACLAENGRDMSQDLGKCGGPADPAVTWSSLAEGGVRACLATVFTEPDGTDAVGYPSGDIEAAHAAGVRQIEWYERWAREGWMSIGVGESPGGEPPAAPRSTTRAVVRVGILVEGADPIRTPDELSWWAARGAVAIGLSWARPSRYSGGNSTPGKGLTDLGRAMISAIDDLGLVHDVSHLSDPAMDELFTRVQGDGRIIASHSNCRALHDGINQRHLRDDSIREIAQRGGIIGLNLYGKFLESPSRGPGTASIADAVSHIEHLCEVIGHRRSVGLGSDMDGGFGASAMPTGIRSPADLGRLLAGLSERGWSAEELEGFSWSNWARFWGIAR